jgi:hypothetical protein
LTKDLITIDGKTNIDDIMFMTGQTSFDNSDQQVSTGPYGYLKINSAFEEDTGEVTAEGKKIYRRLPSGSFMLTLPTIGKVFAETVNFRILQRGFQYSIYNASDNKMVNRSRIIYNFNEEAYDEKGTVKCGSISKKKREGLTPEQLKQQAQIKCTQLLYGLVTFINPVDLDGKPLQGIEDVPVLFRTNGTNFKIMGDLIDEFTSKKKIMATTPITLTTDRQINGTVTYYTLIPRVDYTAKQVWRGEADIEVLTMFKTDIKDTNAQVYAKYSKALETKSKTADDASLVAAIDGSASDALKDDFYDDPIPDMGSGTVDNSKPPSRRKAKSDILMAG